MPHDFNRCHKTQSYSEGKLKNLVCSVWNIAFNSIWLPSSHPSLLLVSYLLVHETLSNQLWHLQLMPSPSIILAPSPSLPVCRLIGLYFNISQCHFCGLQLVLWLQLHSHKNEHWQVWLAAARGTVKLLLPLHLFYPVPTCHCLPQPHSLCSSCPVSVRHC